MWNKFKKRQQPVIVLSGPSGAGKSTIVKEILSAYGPDIMGTTISYTTRSPRSAEREACDYHFVSEEEFLSLKRDFFFAEWTYVYNHYYGTAIDQIDRHRREGRAIIKDFDLKGAEAIKRLYPQTLNIFISPPSVKELVNRVHKRKENSSEDVEIRIGQAPREMEKISQFDYHLENANLQETVEKLKKIIEEYLKQV